MKTSWKILLGIAAGTVATAAAVSIYKTIEAYKKAVENCEDDSCCDCGCNCDCEKENKECNCENCECDNQKGEEYIDVENVPHEECCCCCHCNEKAEEATTEEEKETVEEKPEETSEETKNAE